MRWHDLAFMHWSLDPAVLAPLLPPGLELDTFDGRAYLALVPFRMSDVCPRGTPPLGSLSAFPEMNIRTYARCGEARGVWFFSLDAAQPAAVWLARRMFFLPYFNARMSCRWDRGWCHYSNRRNGPSAPFFEARYRPVGEPFLARPDSLEYWLTERYWLFTESRGRVFAGAVEHGRWPLQRCEVEVESMDMVSWLGLELPGEPLCHFSQLQRVLAWPLSRVPPGR